MKHRPRPGEVTPLALLPHFHHVSHDQHSSFQLSLSPLALLISCLSNHDMVSKVNEGVPGGGFITRAKRAQAHILVCDSLSRLAHELLDVVDATHLSVNLFEKAGALLESGDGWTYRTRDGSRVAHAEHTMVIRDGAPLVLTA